MEYNELDRRRELVASLRDLADFIENVKGVPLPDSCSLSIYRGVLPFENGMHYGMDTKEGAALLADRIGTFNKAYTDSIVTFRKPFGEHASINWLMVRDQVCEKVQVGTVRKAAEPEQIIPAKPERDEPLYEWHCGSVKAHLPQPSSIDMPIEGEYLPQSPEPLQLAPGTGVGVITTEEGDDIPF